MGKTNRPGGAKCCACGVVFPYNTMVKVRRQWYCTNQSQLEGVGKNIGCKDRLEKYGLWPPKEPQKQPTQKGE